MPEVLNFVPAKEGLVALDSFLAGKSEFIDLPPFTLPTQYRIPKGIDLYEFHYYCGSEVGNRHYFHFYLPEEKVGDLDSMMFVIPHKEDTRGENPYFWLDIHSVPDVDSAILTACRFKQAGKRWKVDFQTWHGLEEQLLADYILGLNGLGFTDLLPFNLTVENKNGRMAHRIAGRNSLKVKVQDIKYGETLRFSPKTDDQKLYEWIDIFKYNPLLAEEEWPPVVSYRILSEKHKIYSVGWLGTERQLFSDFTDGLVDFNRLKPLSVKIDDKRKESNLIYLWEKNSNSFYLLLPRSLRLKLGNELTIISEKETEAGADFLLVKDDIPLARYRLDLKTKRFSCIDNLVATKPEEDTFFQEYTDLLHSGQIMSYAAFKRRRQE